MGRFKRWAGYGLGGVAALAVAGTAFVWFGSERALAAGEPATPEHLVRPSPAMLANASRLAHVYACYDCHGDRLQGAKFFDQAGVATLWGPNLTRLAARSSDQQLAAAIRQGIGTDGRALFGMPSHSYASFSDAEVATMIAAIRAEPVGGPERPARSLGPLGRFGIATGKFNSAPVRRTAYLANPPADLGPQHAAGRAIAMHICADCHGSDLKGGEAGPDLKGPDLAIAGAYDLPGFTRLMRTGVPASGRELRMMSGVSRTAFSHMTDAEIASLHGYLVALAQR
ncbi:cytochrome c [Sphingomonas ginkgonis]|uniref:Cytochrome c n=1 Tax=Sphingomonas ginkgonis TaxID=2315330 RepID=A0A3R9WPR6_9SPHN|nr:cytochrome c [Sphingomonas ginkgonis]RST30448.1 cytochrome c [Sphingomonas ginkgonis]